MPLLSSAAAAPPAAEPAIRVLVAGDDRRVRAALAKLLTVAARVEASISTGDLVSILAAASEAGPHVAVIDLVWPGLEVGLAAVRSLRERGIEVVALGADTSMRSSALSAGAIDFVHKDGTTEAVLTAVRLAFANCDARPEDNERDVGQQ